MRYFFAYKVIYIILIISGLFLFLFQIESLSLDSYGIFMIIQGLIFIGVNIFTLSKIVVAKANNYVRTIEISISCYRIGGILIAGTLFGGGLLAFSPLFFSIWKPALNLFHLPNGLIYWYSLLAIMFFAEFKNLNLLIKNKEFLAGNLIKDNL